jgi:hypothetical protein
MHIIHKTKHLNKQKITITLVLGSPLIDKAFFTYFAQTIHTLMMFIPKQQYQFNLIILKQ